MAEAALAFFDLFVAVVDVVNIVYFDVGTNAVLFTKSSSYCVCEKRKIGKLSTNLRCIARSMLLRSQRLGRPLDYKGSFPCEQVEERSMSCCSGIVDCMGSKLRARFSSVSLSFRAPALPRAHRWPQSFPRHGEVGHLSDHTVTHLFEQNFENQLQKTKNMRFESIAYVLF